MTDKIPHYDFNCLNCKFFTEPVIGTMGSCVAVTEQNRNCFSPNGTHNVVAMDFYCKNHEFKDEVLP